MLRRAFVVLALLLIAAPLRAQNVSMLGRVIPQGGGGVGGLTQITDAHITLLGSFKAPTSCGSSDMSVSGSGIAFSAAGNSGAGSILIMTHDLRLAELSIPALVTSSNVANLNTATCLRSVDDPTDGLKDQANVIYDGGESSQTGQVSGLVVKGTTLIISVYVQYDANTDAVITFVTRPADLTQTGVTKGMFATHIASPPTNWLATMNTRALSTISADWTTAMGGDLFASAFIGSIQSRLSWGPNVSTMDSTAITGVNGITATTISAANGDNSFNDSGAGLPVFVAGDKIKYFNRDTTTDVNKSVVWNVVSRTASKIVVNGGTVTTKAAGDKITLVKSIPVVNIPLYGDSGRGMTGACGQHTAYNIVGHRYDECGDAFGGKIGSTYGTNYKDWSTADRSQSWIQPKGTSTLLAIVTHGTATNTTNPNTYGYGYGCDSSQTDLTYLSLTSYGADPGGCGASTEGYWYDVNFTGAKGNHGAPYTYHFIAYKMGDLQAVKNGSGDARDVLPYTSWDLTLPIMPASGDYFYCAATYDETNNRIYLAQIGPNSGYPIINVLQVTP